MKQGSNPSSGGGGGGGAGRSEEHTPELKWSEGSSAHTANQTPRPPGAGCDS